MFLEHKLDNIIVPQVRSCNSVHETESNSVKRKKRTIFNDVQAMKLSGDHLYLSAGNMVMFKMHVSSYSVTEQ